MSKFEFDRQWESEELFAMPGLLEMLEDEGESKRDEAIRLAGKFNRTGNFQRSIKGELLSASNGRPFYRVWSDDPAAISIEFGTKNAPAHRVLGRAIDKWKDVNTLKHPSLNKKRRVNKKVEKSIDKWAKSVLGRGVK
jgi:hypothetical protein